MDVAGVSTFAGNITGSSALYLTGELNLTGGSAATRYIDAFVGEAGTFALRGTNNADSSGHQVMMEMRRNAGVHLNYSGNTKLQTSSTGVSITGSIAATGEVNIPTWLVHAGDSDTKFGFEGPDTITFETAGSERLRIDSAGNLSLGKGSASSTSYGTNLQIHHSGTSGASIHLTDNNTGSSNGDGFHILTSSSHAYLWQRENANMVFGTQGIARWVMYGSDGTLAPNVDSTFDIGTSSIRVRNGYFDTLYGDGSNLTGITGTTINNNADNRIITGSGTANTLNGESTFTYGGSAVTLANANPQIRLTDTDDSKNFDMVVSGGNGFFSANSSGMNMIFEVTGSERARIGSSGGVGINTTLIRNNRFLNIAAPSLDYTNTGSDLCDAGGGIMLQPTDTLLSTGRSYPGIFWTGNTASLGRARAGIIGVAASNNDATHIAFLTRTAANGTGFYPSDERMLSLIHI